MTEKLSRAGVLRELAKLGKSMQANANPNTCFLGKRATAATYEHWLQATRGTYREIRDEGVNVVSALRRLSQTVNTGAERDHLELLIQAACGMLIIPEGQYAGWTVVNDEIRYVDKAFGCDIDRW